MTDTNSYRKWFYRCVLIFLGLAAAYVVLQPQYNFAHWVPHRLLRSIGIPYSVLLMAESNADKLLHPLLAFIFTILLVRSRLGALKTSDYRSMQLLIFIMIAVECAQWFIGRGFGISDILLGTLGSYLAIRYLSSANRRV